MGVIMKSPPAHTIIFLLLLLPPFPATAIEPEIIVQVSGRWDNWQVTPTMAPLCDAYDFSPALSYILPDSSIIENDYMAVGGTLNEEIVLPLRDISIAGVVDSTGTVWIADVGENWYSISTEDLKSLELTETEDIWTGWLGVYACDYIEGVFLLSFRKDSSMDTLFVDLAIRDEENDSTFVKTVSKPILSSSDYTKLSPKVFIHSYSYDAPVLYSFYDNTLLLDDCYQNPPVVVWWYDSMIAAVSYFPFFPPCYEYYGSTKTFEPLENSDFQVIGNAAYPYWAAFGNLQSLWQICRRTIPVDTVLALHPPEFAVPQWGSTNLAAWASQSFTSGWILSWLDTEGNIHTLSERKEIDNIQIEIYRRGSTLPGTGWPAYGGYMLFWSEYDSENDVTTLYKIRNWTVGVEECTASKPVSFQLVNVWPNPFNSTAHVRFYVPEATRIKAELYNLLGQRVRLVGDEARSAGYHTTTINGADIASGIYLLKLSNSSGSSMAKRVTLVR